MEEVTSPLKAVRDRIEVTAFWDSQTVCMELRRKQLRVISNGVHFISHFYLCLGYIFTPWWHFTYTVVLLGYTVYL